MGRISPPHAAVPSCTQLISKEEVFCVSSLIFIYFCQLVQLKPWRSVLQQRMIVEFMLSHLLCIVVDLEENKKKIVLKMTAFTHVCSFIYLFLLTGIWCRS